MIRVWLGMNWLQAGWHKTREAAWTSGLAVKGYWEHVVVIPEQGRPLIAYDWYRDFLEFLLRNELHGVFGPLVAWGEVPRGSVMPAFRKHSRPVPHLPRTTTLRRQQHRQGNRVG